MEERAKIFTQLLTTHELPYACFKNENFIIFGDFLNEFKKFNKMHDNGRRFGGGERSSIVSSTKNNYHIYHFYVFFFWYVKILVKILIEIVPYINCF